MLARSDSSELAVIAISFGILSACVESSTASWEDSVIVETPPFDGMPAPIIEEVSLAGEVLLVENSLLEVVIAEEESLIGEASISKVWPGAKKSPLFKKPFCSPFAGIVAFASDGADSRITCAFVPP